MYYAKTGEPTLLQQAASHCSHHVRTFAFDAGGTLMVAASIKSMLVRDGSYVTTVPAALVVFRAGAGGRLDLVRKYDVDTVGGKTHYSGWG